MALECGAVYWMPDPQHVVRPAILTTYNNDEYKFDYENGAKLILSPSDPKLKQLTHVDPQCMDTSIDDLIRLNSLSENALLHILRGRFSEDTIYTFVSSILIAVNPFKSLPIYNDETIECYRTSSDQTTLPPHIFRTTDDVYRGMLATSMPYSIIISGESGAGKTETIKFVLKYLTRLSEAAARGASTAPILPNAPLSVQDQIMQSNVILEAFGNAKTSRNNNSSRFGKLITLQFSRGVMKGAEIISYLLEKSRVVHQGDGEGSFHAFYQLLNGCEHHPKIAQLTSLDKNTHYSYLNDSNETSDFVNSGSVRELFNDLISGLEVIGVTEAQRADIFRVLAVILRLGNINFAERDDEQAEIINSSDLESVCALAGLSHPEISRCFTSRQFGVRSIITCHLTLEQATDARNAFTKAMYSFLFDWLVGALNKCLMCQESCNPNAFIAVLDIFGFEAFKENSFEQLLINYCNEKLLTHFNSYIFVMEQEEYSREGISFDFCEFKDNTPTIMMLEKSPTGVIAMMDEEIVLPKGSDEKLLDKIFTKHMKKDLLSRAMARKEKSSECKFVVNHFAGEVAYDIRGFLEKNRDAVPPSFIDIGASSSIPFVADLFKKDAEANNATGGAANGRSYNRTPANKGQAKKLTLGGRFKKELNDLVDTLNKTTPRFVRCMKSNMLKQGNTFESDVMLKQLRYSGLLEVCRIRQSGFPSRISYDDFLKGYWTLDSSASSGRELVERLREKGHFYQSQYQLGTTKIFFKNEAIDVLNNIRFQALYVYARRIQAFCKGFLIRKKWKLIMSALQQLADANATGKEEDLMLACNLVSETVPHQGLHLQVMLDSLMLIEKLQGEEGEYDYDEEDRVTEECTMSDLERHRPPPPPPAPSFPPPPPPKEDNFNFDKANELPKPIPPEPVVRKVITRRVSQEEINIAERLQKHIETIFSCSKSREGLSEEDLNPLNEAIALTLECEDIRDEDIGLLNEAADELERATRQISVQRKIEDAVLNDERNIELLRSLYIEGNELAMNNYEGMLVIQQVIQRKALKETTTGSSGEKNDLKDLVDRLRRKSADKNGVSHQDLADVENMLEFLLDKYGECSLPEVQIARQEVTRCKTQIDIQESLGHVNHRSPRKILKELWRQGKEIGMTEYKGFILIDKILYPELSAGAPNVIKIIDGLRAQAVSSHGVSKEDIESLENVLKRLAEVGLSDSDKSFRIASKLLIRVTKQYTVQNALAKVTVMTPLTAKQSLWKQGCKLKMEKFFGMVALKAMLGDFASEHEMVVSNAPPGSPENQNRMSNGKPKEK